jgi:thiol:disulfide interchange protein
LTVSLLFVSFQYVYLAALTFAIFGIINDIAGSQFV